MHAAKMATTEAHQILLQNKINLKVAHLNKKRPKSYHLLNTSRSLPYLLKILFDCNLKGNPQTMAILKPPYLKVFIRIINWIHEME